MYDDRDQECDFPEDTGEEETIIDEEAHPKVFAWYCRMKHLATVSKTTVGLKH